jgi:hypothetical protein
MLTDRSQGKPWYREPWPWLLMAGPAAVIVAGVFTTVLAYRTEDGLVADDYYKQGLAINRVLKRDERARELNLAAVASFAGDRVRVVLRDAGEAPRELRLRLIHPTRSGRDRSLILTSTAPGVYDGTVAGIYGEMRRLVLEDAGATWRLIGTWSGGEEPARLEAAR